MTEPAFVRYYVYIKKSIRGPFPPREAITVPGFDRTTLVCTEKALGQWVEATHVADFQPLLDAPPAQPAKPKPPRAPGAVTEEAASRSLLEKAIAKNAQLENEVREMRKTYTAEKAAFDAALKKKEWETKSLTDKLRRNIETAQGIRGEHPSWEMLYKTLKKRSEDKFYEVTQALGEKSAEIIRLKETVHAMKEAAEAAKKQQVIDEAARTEELTDTVKELRSQLEEKEITFRTLGDNINSLVAKNEELQRIMLDERRDAEEQARKFCEEIGQLKADLKWHEQEAESIRADLQEAMNQARSQGVVDELRHREQDEVYDVIGAKLRLLAGYFENLEARVKFAFRKA